MEIAPAVLAANSPDSSSSAWISTSKSVSVNITNDEEEEDVCRICRNSGDSENPLRFPCACRGSIRYVHEKCLLRWLNQKNSRYCEVCKHPYSFSPVYAENTPERLPFQEILIGLAKKFYVVLKFFLLLSVLLLVIPFVTFWIWRFSFVRSFTEAHTLFLSHISTTTLILTDCFYGFLLLASIVLGFLAARSLRNYFRHLREVGGQDGTLFRMFLVALMHLMTIIKVAFLLVIGLVVLPLMCGWWLDVCTLSMFGKSISQRVDFFLVYPLEILFIHWCLGTLYMLLNLILVDLLREVLREGVLYFLQDLLDPNYNVFRGLINDPLHKHACRILLSASCLGSLIVMLVFYPVKLAIRMAPSVFPLDIFPYDSLTEFPFMPDVLSSIMFAFSLLLRLDLRPKIKSVLRYWFVSVGGTLGLNGYLLPTLDDVQENGNDPLHANHAQEFSPRRDRGTKFVIKRKIEVSNP